MKFDPAAVCVCIRQGLEEEEITPHLTLGRGFAQHIVSMKWGKALLGA